LVPSVAFRRHAGYGCATVVNLLEERDELPRQASETEPEEEAPRRVCGFGGDDDGEGWLVVGQAATLVVVAGC
jgi:hypothetical protein